MLQYKTTCMPSIAYTIKKKEFENDITLDIANKAIAPVGSYIEAEARGGWKLHSVTIIPQCFKRKKTIFEVLLGWIPILGPLMFPRMYDETVQGHDKDMYVLVFVKEV